MFAKVNFSLGRPTAHLAAFLLLVAAAPLSAPAQTADTSSAGQKVLPPLPERSRHSAAEPFTVVGRSDDTKTWARSVAVTNAGRVFYRQEAFTEIGSGICYSNPATAQLEDASPGFRIENGRAIADRSRHVLSVEATLDDPEGFLQCRLPDGKMFRSAVLGIWVYDPVTGSSLQISSPRTGDAAVVGEQTASNAITWSDAFEGMLRASLRVRNEVGQFHHDVVLNEKLSEAQLKRLAELGFGPEMRIEVITEILASPSPSVQTVTLRSESDPARRAAMVEPDLADAVVQFGSAALGPGVGFADDDSGRTIPIARQLLQRDNRTVLIEAARYVDLLPLLANLPPSRMTVMNRTPSNGRMFAERPRREETLVAGVSKPMSIAPLDATARRPREAEVTIDFSLLQGSLTNFCFDNRTFYVTAQVNLYGATKILPLSVIKIAPTNSARLVLQPNGTLECPSGAFSMAVITVRDDNTIGTSIPGSDGVPERAGLGIYGNYASLDLRNLRFAHQSTAVSTLYDFSASHCQFVDCGTAINTGISASLQNVLFAQCGTCVDFAGSACAPNCPTRVAATHVTADDCSKFLALPGQWTYYGQLSLTNSLITAVPNLTYGWPVTVTTNASQILASNQGVYERAAAGGFYLPSGSPCRDAGVPVGAALSSELGQKTTWAPTVICASVLAESSVTFSPHVLRDNDGLLDLGFHADCLDYAVAALYLTNATLAVSPGTAVGTFGTNSWTYGIGLDGGAVFDVRGAPDALCRIVDCSIVQEYSGTNDVTQPSYASVTDNFQGNPQSTAARFTHWAAMGESAAHYAGMKATPVSFQNCEFRGGKLVSMGTPVTLRNCLLERVGTELESWEEVTPTFRNCLVKGGSFYYWASVTNTVIKDNLFDGAIVTDTGLVCDGGFNAYVTNAATSEYHLTPMAPTDLVLSASPDYRAGPLGNYYLPSGGNLINADTNTTANQVGLFHFTTMTNLVNNLQVKEQNSQLDLSYHYPALDQNGKPIDSDADGIADVMEDLSGDGVTDSGETDWTIANEPGLRVRITRPSPAQHIP